MTFDLQEHGVAAILLDIEGTTTPIAFVHDTLYSYARERLYPYLRAHFVEDRVRDLLTTLRVEWQEDARTKQEPPPWALADIPAAARYLEWLMDLDRKSPSLKHLQGEIWAEGFRDGTLRGEVFDDVPAALQRWRASRLRIAIYSSGSVLAQKMLFGTTRHGDLTEFLSGFFDTAVGPKGAADSYRRIASSIGSKPGQVLFLSDVPGELAAARAAGCQVLLAVRPGNAAVISPTEQSIQTFDEVV